MKRPKKSHLMPIVIGMAAVGAYLMFGKSASAAPTPTPTPQPPQPVPVQQDHVAQTSGGLMTTGQAQKMLKSLGPQASNSVMANLVIDGAWGPQTSKAVANYQAIKGSPLPMSGELDPASAATLANDYNAFIASGGTPAV